MITTLSRFDKVTAAGILARAAVALDDDANPVAHQFRVPSELELRTAILEEIRAKLGIAVTDCTRESLERLEDVLDDEMEALVGPTDTQKALANLSAQGDLPSDLFEVVAIPNIIQFYGKRFDQEEKIIRETVSKADQEQHFGPPVAIGEPFLISLFTKHYPNKFPLRSFTMLVAGQRTGLVLTVQQAWRVYADLVDTVSAKTLVDLLRNFSNAFKAELLVNGKKGNFFLSENIRDDHPSGTEITILHPTDKHGNPAKGTHTQTVSCFEQKDPISRGTRVSLIVGVNLTKYKAVLEERAW